MNSVAVIVPIAFLIGFPIFFMSIIFLLSRLSGWASLAAHYGTNAEPKGTRFVAQSMGLGFSSFFMVSYSGVITAHISETDLYLQSSFIFKIGHRRLKIPLEHIQSRPGRILFFDVTNLKFRRAENIKGRVFKNLAKALSQITAEL